MLHAFVNSWKHYPMVSGERNQQESIELKNSRKGISVIMENRI